MAVLPLALVERCFGCFSKGGSIAYGGCSVDRGGNRMRGDMGCGHCLTCGPCRGAGRSNFGIASGCMGSKRSTTYICHLKDTGTHPGAARINRLTRSRISWIF